MESNKPILCLDFDGVIHQYNSGWQGPLKITDDVTDGFFEWLGEASEYFKIVIYSSRSKEPGAINAMAVWMTEQHEKWKTKGGQGKSNEHFSVEFSDTKPPAFLQIDDRAICFDGDWSKLKPADLREFKPWNK